MKAALSFALATALLAGCASEPPPSRPISAQSLEKLSAVKLDPAEAGRILNAYRAGKGLTPVRLDPTLTAMAQRQVQAMVAANALSHDAGGSFTARVHSAGLDSVRAAENLGAGYYSTAEAFAGWRQSAGHDANLLMPEATRYGIALAKDGNTRYRTWWAIVLAADPEVRRGPDAGPRIWFGSNAPPVR